MKIEGLGVGDGVLPGSVLVVLELHLPAVGEAGSARPDSALEFDPALARVGLRLVVDDVAARIGAHIAGGRAARTGIAGDRGAGAAVPEGPGQCATDLPADVEGPEGEGDGRHHQEGGQKDAGVLHGGGAALIATARWLAGHVSPSYLRGLQTD